MNSITPLIDEANRTLAAAIKHFSLSVPMDNILVTIQSKGRKNAVGWFWNGRWSQKKDKKNALHEINMSAEHLRDYDMGELLIHELAHAENDHQGIKDCAGRRHNKKFKVMAERLGLKVEKSKSLGFAHTQLDAPAKSFLDGIKFNRELFTTCRIMPEKKGAVGSRLLKIVCPDCEYTCRTTQKWLDVGLPKCPCGKLMEVA